MSEFSELIKSFDKIREYMRDFYIYGFKIRGEYTYKSARTYDNERRRISCWLQAYIRWEQNAKGKRVFLSMDSAQVAQNPLYAAWKSKSFTKSDITLHFFLLDRLSDGREEPVEALTDHVSEASGVVFDAQTVRNKLREYEGLGLLRSRKIGRALVYALAENPLEQSGSWGALLDGVKFFQEAAPFGFIGSTVLDGAGAQNDLFRFKHEFIVHTLEDGVLEQLLEAMKNGQSVCLENKSRRSGKTTVFYGVPLKILTSTQNGRRYVCLYLPERRRFLSVRLDAVTSVIPGDPVYYTEEICRRLEENLPSCWGVSFGDHSRGGWIFMKLQIDEQREQYVLDRLTREGRGGEVLRVEENCFLYSKKVFDCNEMLPWVKTFTGRILSLECSDKFVMAKFYRDMDDMYRIYRDMEADSEENT